MNRQVAGSDEWPKWWCRECGANITPATQQRHRDWHVWLWNSIAKPDLEVFAVDWTQEAES